MKKSLAIGVIAASFIFTSFQDGDTTRIVIEDDFDLDDIDTSIVTSVEDNIDTTLIVNEEMETDTLPEMESEPSAIIDTTTNEDTTAVEEEIQVKVFQGLNWGITTDEMIQLLELDSSKFAGNGKMVNVYGKMGPDSVRFTYYFSDLGFWKVKIMYILNSVAMDELIGNFIRIENIVIKKYNVQPKRTTRNELGTDLEYILSKFPLISQSYFRSSWIVDSLNVELLLDAQVQVSQLDVPVFEDLNSSLILYYYNSNYFGYATQDSLEEISEKEILESY
tara:strand:- start:1259 stop:2092 length:834 start_codon:yes stop_codon:yes gene_type:complete